MSDIEYAPELIATKDEIRAAVRKIAINSDAYNFVEFRNEVESIGSDLIIPPEMDWVVEEALQEYRSLALDEENGHV
ncbi:hypothetical protein [Pseudomonas salomonii]|uniref:Uncharacterized protein n=1 Tax=Pseudomonas salomonii TaxID=191391 RepID=A0A1H3IJB2_9PSED|nr:hypothetical protein [Pseudomonas salomonii]SDY27771.1 hypothetical protein SAMN05216247_103278 [Pseudomonas salomonii]